MILISRAYIPCEPWRGIFLHSRFDSAHIWGQNRAERGQIRYQRAAEYFTRKLFRLCLDCFNHTNIGECHKKHWQSLQIHELRTNLILANISLQSWIKEFFNQVKKSYLKKQAKKLRFLPLLIGFRPKYCSAGDGVSWQSIPKTIYASVLNALIVMCSFLIWTQIKVRLRQLGTTKLIHPQDGHCSILSGGVFIQPGRYPSHHPWNQKFTTNLWTGKFCRQTQNNDSSDEPCHGVDQPKHQTWNNWR